MRHARNSCQPKYESERKWIGHFCPHILTVRAYACAQTHPTNDDDNNSDGVYGGDDATDRHFRTNLHISVSFITKFVCRAKVILCPMRILFLMRKQNLKRQFERACVYHPPVTHAPHLVNFTSHNEMQSEKTRNRTLLTIVAKYISYWCINKRCVHPDILLVNFDYFLLLTS